MSTKITLAEKIVTSAPDEREMQVARAAFKLALSTVALLGDHELFASSELRVQGNEVVYEIVPR